MTCGDPAISPGGQRPGQVEDHQCEPGFAPHAPSYIKLVTAQQATFDEYLAGDIPVTDGMLHIDDSSGIIGHDLRDLTGLYARACAIAPPDPAKLAEWLVASRCDGPGWLISMSRISLRRSAKPGWPTSRGS
jgi:hypothetical protein